MRILLIGGSGYVGSAAREVLGVDHEVVVVGRSTEPGVDITSQQSIRELFDATGQFDAVVVAAGSVPFGPLGELTREDYTSAFTGKVLGQIDVVRIGTAHVRDGGSFTLTSGVLARHAIAAGSATSMANGALESFVMAAAPEMPRGIRINAVSPTVLASAPEFFDSFPGFVPVEPHVVGMAFRRSVEGVDTGQVFELD